MCCATCVRKVHCGMFHDNLEDLLSLARSDLAYCVRNLTLYTDAIPPLSKEAHRNAWLANREKPSRGDEATSSQELALACSQAYAQYTHLASQQSRWTPSIQGESLERCIVRFTCLGRVELKVMADTNGFSASLWNRIKRQTGISVRNFEAHWLDMSRESYLGKSASVVEEAYVAVMGSIKARSEILGARMLELHLHGIPESIAYDDSTLHPAALAKVAALSIQVSTLKSEDAHPEYFWNGLSRALQNATSLTRLGLSISERHFKLMDEPSQFWPKLEHLRLEGSISFSEAQKIIDGHQSSLKSLALRCLPRGELFNFLEAIRNTVALERIHCFYLCHESERRFVSLFTGGRNRLTAFVTELEKYLLRERKQMPDTGMILSNPLS